MVDKRLKILIVAFAGIAAALFIVNRWIGREMARITQMTPPEKHAPLVAMQIEETARPRPVVIDPLNDPLAPIAPRAPKKSSTKVSSPRPTEPQRVYEPSLETHILVQ